MHTTLFIIIIITFVDLVRLTWPTPFTSHHRPFYTLRIDGRIDISSNIVYNAHVRRSIRKS